MNSISRHTGTILIVGGLVHLLVSFVLDEQWIIEIMKDGVFSTLLKPESFVRMSEIGFLETWNIEAHYTVRFAMFHFWLVGILVIFTGVVINTYVKTTQQQLPRSWGLFLILLGVITSVIIPISGYWAFILIGLPVLLAKR